MASDIDLASVFFTDIHNYAKNSTQLLILMNMTFQAKLSFA
jgi:hypothetical protein